MASRAPVELIVRAGAGEEYTDEHDENQSTTATAGLGGCGGHGGCGNSRRCRCAVGRIGRPRGANYALAGIATQSSTWGQDPTLTANRAIDGNTDGILNHGSTTHTEYEDNPWLQVDIGDAKTLSNVTVFPRTDCCQDRWATWYVFVSSQPFDTTLTPAVQATRPGVTARLFLRLLTAGDRRPVGNDGTLRHDPGCRRQLLSLAEVQVWGMGETDGSCRDSVSSPQRPAVCS